MEEHERSRSDAHRWTLCGVRWKCKAAHGERVVGFHTGLGIGSSGGGGGSSSSSPSSRKKASER